MATRIGKYKISKKETAMSLIDGGTTTGQVTIPQLYGGVQRSAADAAFTISANSTLVILALDVTGSRIVTLPAATVGRHFRVIWEVEQDSHNRVFTCAGSDVVGGNITTKVQGNAAGDGDVVAVTITTVAITTLPDVNIGSYLDFHCGVAGTWLVTGEIVVDAVGSVPTLA